MAGLQALHHGRIGRHRHHVHRHGECGTQGLGQQAVGIFFFDLTGLGNERQAQARRLLAGGTGRLLLGGRPARSPAAGAQQPDQGLAPARG
ncbi:hypothetical protein D3C79_963040 [compost metagenome]